MCQRERAMSGENSGCGMAIGALLLWVASPVGWLYYMWVCFTLQIFGWFIAGILLPPVAVVLGLWSLLFGVPGFMLPDGF